MKNQINFRLPDSLIAALKARAEAEGVTSTELVQRLLEIGLGLSSSELAGNDPRIEERIASQLVPLQSQLDERIEKRIASQLTPIQQEIEQRIEQRIQAVIQSKVDAVLGECSA